MFQTRENGKTKTIALSNSIPALLNAKCKYWLENFNLDIRRDILIATMQYFNLDDDIQEIVLEVESYENEYTKSVA